MEAPQGRVACILVNWNGAEDTLRCLRSLELQTWRALDVLIVDNGSTDGSGEQIAAYLKQRAESEPITMTLIETGVNAGFASGNNTGLRAALPLEPCMCWLLNNDTECPPETLAKLMREAEQSPAAGVVGSVLFYAGEPGRVQAWGGGHVWPSVAFTTHFVKARQLRRNDYLTFASVLLRPAMLRQIGLLSEDFFMYFEDVELCLRAQRAGWRLAVAADTAILHRVGASSNATLRPQMESIVTASGMRLIEKQGRWPAAGKLLFVTARLLRRVLLGQWTAAGAVWSAAAAEPERS